MGGICLANRASWRAGSSRRGRGLSRSITIAWTATVGIRTATATMSSDHLLPTFDQACAALLTDLDERGLLDETLVVAMGEMGRTPTPTKNWGRNHWSTCFPCLLAGGGIRGGIVYGQDRPQGRVSHRASSHAGRPREDDLLGARDRPGAFPGEPRGPPDADRRKRQAAGGFVWVGRQTSAPGRRGRPARRRRRPAGVTERGTASNHKQRPS